MAADPQTKQTIREMNRGGESYGRIAKQLGLTKSMVSAALSRNVPADPKRADARLRRFSWEESE